MLHARLIALLPDAKIIIGAGVAIGKHVRAIENIFLAVNGIHHQRRIRHGKKLHGLARAVDQPMPGVERRREEAPRPPLEHLLAPAFLPYFGGALTVENTDHLFVEMFLRLERAARRDLADVHAGHAFHAVKIYERCLAAGASPLRRREIPDIFDTISVDRRNILALHPLEILGFSKRRHEGFYSFVL